MADALVFGSHPDDAEFGMGATIVKMIENGLDVAICVLTKGEAGTHGTPEQREEEMKAAAKTAGAEIEILDFEDCKIFDSYEGRVKLAEVIRKHKPKAIFAPYHTNKGSHLNFRAHPDHTATGELARHASRYARFKGLEGVKGDEWNAEAMIYYFVPKDIKPDLVVDVSDYLKKWEETVRCHESQLELIDGNLVEYLKEQRINIGREHGCDNAEVFLTDEPIPKEFNFL